jgi:hypothetical protein
MGLFTSIIHPEDGRELQIKCGQDACEWFRVGDDVGAQPDPYNPGSGYLLDDVYDSYSDRGEDDWVVISGGRVVAVEPRSEDPSLLRAKYNVHPPPREWWTEEAWANKAQREAEAKADLDKFMGSISHLPEEERLAKAMIYPIMRTLGYASIARRAFSIEPATDPKTPK